MAKHSRPTHGKARIAPPSRMSRTVRQEQLLAVAQESFAQNGYQGTSIEKIAEAAGVTRPIVYNCFGSKDGIYLACLVRARELLEAGMLQAVAGADDARSRLEAGFDAYFSFVSNQGSAWEVLFGGGAAIAGPAEAEARALRFQTVGQIAALLQRDLPGVDAGQVEALAHAVSGAAEQLAKWWRQHPSVSREQVVGRLMTLCWTGLEATHARSRR